MKYLKFVKNFTPVSLLKKNQYPSLLKNNYFGIPRTN